MRTNRCSKCHETISAPEPGSCTTGYGTDKRGRKVCFACCAIADREYMRKNGKIDLYLVHAKNPISQQTWEVTNWPGTLRFPCASPRKGRHNIAGTRYDVWFDCDGDTWHGVQYGEYTQVCHCSKVAS